MDALIPFSIPIQGLKNGVHYFEFQVDSDFFRQFESSPVEEGQFDVTLKLDKRSDMMVLDFEHHGTVLTECDRCLASIHLPVSGHEQLVVKYSEEASEEDAEVIYITPATSDLNVAQYVYEFICLAIPISRVYDCELDPSPPCNQEMLRYLANESDDDVPSKKDDEDPDNPVWNVLKDLK